MFSSPGTPRRPQTATERLNCVRNNLHQLRETVQTGETFALAHLANSSHCRSGQSKSARAPAEQTKQSPTPPNLQHNPPRRDARADMEGDGNQAPNNDATARASKVATTIVLSAPQSCGGMLPSAASLKHFDDVVISMKQHAIKIEEHLAVEASARQEMDRKLKSLMDQRIRDAVTLLEKKASERIAELHHHVESLTRRTENLQAELATEREKNVRLTQELKYQVTHGMSEVKEHVNQVRSVSQSSQSILAKNLAENILRLQEKLDVERHTRESVLQAVREEMHATKNRDKIEDRALQRLRDDISALEVQLKRERETREKGEEQLAATMEEVVSQIQLGLRNISR